MARKEVVALALLAFMVSPSVLAQATTSGTAQPDRRPGIMEPRDREQPKTPNNRVDPSAQRPEIFSRTCDDQLRDAQQMVRNQKERIVLLDYIRAELEKENANLKTSVSSLESQIDSLRKQLSARKN